MQEMYRTLMKKNTIAAAVWLLTLGSAYQAHCQNLSVGDAVFGSASDQVPAEWFWPMPAGVTNTFEGFGDNEGLSKTEKFSLGETVAGIKTVKRHVEGSAPAVPVEDWWLAADTNGDLRVLRVVRAGALVFEASATATPPMVLPGAPAEGQTWDLFGKTMTVEWVALSFSGARLKVTETSGANTTCNYYHAGTGVTQTESGSSSGWRRMTRATNPLPPLNP